MISGDSSASGHELRGGDVAEQRVPPAQQRLDRDGAVHDDVDDGLELQPQLAALQRAVEVGAQGGAAVLRDAQGVVVAVHGDPGPAARALRRARSPRRRASPVSTSADSAVTPAAAVRREGAAGDRRAGRRRRPGGRPRSRRRRCCRRRGRRSRRPCRGPASPRRAGARVSRAVIARRTAVSVVGGEDVGASPLSRSGPGRTGGPAASRCTAPSRRTSAARLGRPVTGSVRESSSSSASTPGRGAREVTSRQYRTSAPTSGSARRSRTVAWMSRQRPSAWRMRAVRTASSSPLGGGAEGAEQGGRVVGWTPQPRLPAGDVGGGRRAGRRPTWEAKVTRRSPSRMTTGSTLLFTSVRNAAWLRCRAPVSRR